VSAGRRSNGEGSVPVKRKDGRWQVAYTVETTGKRAYVYGKTAKEAREKR
jgi:hypothetical protein